MIDETHDPKLESWVESANPPGGDFPIQNLPFCVFVPPGTERPRVGVGVGDFILDLQSLVPGSSLNQYLRLPAGERGEIRKQISRLLEKGAPRRDLIPQDDCALLVPCEIGDYTDFYASIHHATNVGRMFRPDSPLLPNYKHVPIAYHGRASSIVISGTAVHRPSGQLGEGIFGPCAKLDYEMELGVFVGPGNSLGEAIPIGEADTHIAGFCLVNDWSARDIQRWEYQPLGPFLAKNFATTISPWLITAEALAPFHAAAPEHDVPVLPYLQAPLNSAFNITVESRLRTRSMSEAVRISRANFRDMYWTPAQMIAHHTSNGCPLRPGDLLASGTISGPELENRGCLLELTWNGAEPLKLPSGETRMFLADGDEVILTGYCEREGFRRIGLGPCSGVVTL